MHEHKEGREHGETADRLDQKSLDVFAVFQLRIQPRHRLSVHSCSVRCKRNKKATNLRADADRSAPPLISQNMKAENEPFTEGNTVRR